MDIEVAKSIYFSANVIIIKITREKKLVLLLQKLTSVFSDDWCMLEI